MTLSRLDCKPHASSSRRSGLVEESNRFKTRQPKSLMKVHSSRLLVSIRRYRGSDHLDVVGKILIAMYYEDGGDNKEWTL